MKGIIFPFHPTNADTISDNMLLNISYYALAHKHFSYIRTCLTLNTVTL